MRCGAYLFDHELAYPTFIAFVKFCYCAGITNLKLVNMGVKYIC